MADNNNSGGRGGWPYALIGVPFVAASLGLLCLAIVPNLLDWQRMKSWRMVEARLDEARLRNLGGSESDSYQVEARYRYVVDGREYGGTRVAISRAADSVGDFQLALGAELEETLRLQRPFWVWVNPLRPGEAVIDRSLRGGLFTLQLVFMLAFGGIGALMLHLRKHPPPSRYAPRVCPPTSPAADARALAGVVRHEAIPGGIRLVIPYGSRLPALLAALLGGPVVIAIAMAMHAAEAPLPFPLLFGGTGAAFALHALWELATRRQIELDRQYGLRSERRLLGLVIARERIPAREIRALTAGLTWSSGGASAPNAYRIQVRTLDDRKVTLVDRVPGRGAAERLLREIGTNTGLALDLG